MPSRTPPIFSEFRGGGLNTPNPPSVRHWSCPRWLEKLHWCRQDNLIFHTGIWSLSEIWRGMSTDTDVLLWVKESLIKCCSLELYIVAERFILMVVGFVRTVNNFDKGTLPPCGYVTMLLASLSSWGSVACSQQRVKTRAVLYNNNNNNNNNNNTVFPGPFVRNFRKNNDECILILVIYWKRTGLLHAKISNHNIIYSS